MTKLLYTPWFFDIAKLGVACTEQQDGWTSPLISGANVTAFLLVIPPFFEFVCAGSLQALVLDSFRFFFYAC